MRNDLPVNLPVLPFVCGQDCPCATAEEDESVDMRVVFRAGRTGTYDANVLNEDGDLIDVVRGYSIEEALNNVHRAYPFASSHSIENTSGPVRNVKDSKLDMGDE